MALIDINSTAFCDKNTWYSGNNASYAPAAMRDGVSTTRWIGTQVDATASLQNFAGIKFTAPTSVKEITINIASWGRNVSIGTWATGADPASASFTKADIIPIRSIDAVNELDANGQTITSSKVLRFILNTATIPGIIIYCDNNATSGLTNTSGGANTNQSIYELNAFYDNNTGTGYVKIADATAFATSTWNDFGGVANMNDGSTATGWSSAGTYGQTVAEYGALRFSSPQQVTKIEVIFYSWGPIIVVGESDGTPATPPTSGDGKGSNGFRVLRTIDIRVTPNDDLGVPWANGGGNRPTPPYNTILLTNSSPSTLIGLYSPDTSTSALTVPGYPLDRLRIMELTMYTGNAVPIVDGINPKPPIVVPVSPFSALPANWSKRTEFSAAGDFTFTPDSKTTLLMAVLQGAGSGGQVLKNLDLSDTSFGTVNNGEDSFIATSDGVTIERAGGAQKNLAGAIKHLLSSLVGINWHRYGATAGVAGTAQTLPNGSSPAGAASPLGTAGATYALQQFTGANLGNVDFKSANSETVFPAATLNGFVRDDTLGWVSQNTGGSTTGSVTFQPIQLNAGQTVNFTYSTSSEVTDRLAININGANVVYIGGVITDRVYTYTAATTGSYTIAFSYSKDATVDQGSNRVNVTNMSVSGANYPLATSGGSGSIQSVFLEPRALKLHVGAGGVGVSGGQTVPASANGARGSGGAGGAKGGDGVIVIYEFNGQVPFEKPVTPFTLAQFNLALTTEVTGFYRTDYVNPVVDTTLNVTHYLRPRTKSVIALIVGAGGSAMKGETQTRAMDPTVISSSKVSHSAGSGFSAFGPNNGMTSGAGGVYTGTREAILSKNGMVGGNGSQSVANPSGITGGYGDGSGSYAYVYNGGGSASYALVLIGADDFDNQTLNIKVPGIMSGGSAPGKQGAVFLFETETVFGPQISGMTELFLRKEAQSATQVSQASELVMYKERQSATQITQMSELILQKESLDADLQISHMNVAFIYTYSDPFTAISQASELLLMKSGPNGTQVSNASELLLMKSGKLDTRISQSPGMIFMAELASIFYMDFGTLEYPVKNQLYTSIVKRATSVKEGTYIQLEGNLAPGSTMFVNGVDVGRSASVKDRDEINLYAGVTNYWQTTINVYAYYTTNGQVTRELVGLWKVLQPNFTPVPTRAYAAYAGYTWIKTMHGFAISNLIPDFVKANSTYAAFVDFLVAKTQMSAVAVNAIATKALATVFSNAGATWAQNHSQYDEAEISWEAVKALSNTADLNGYEVTKAMSKYTIILTGGIKADAIAHDATPFDFGIVPASLHEENLFDFELVQPVSQFYTNTDYEKISVSYGDYTYEVNVASHAGYGTVKVIPEKWNVDHTETSDATFLPIQFTHYFGIFDVAPMSTIAYSTLTGVDYEKSEVRGTGWYLMPTGNAYIHKAGYGTFTLDQSITSIAYSTPSDRGTEKTGASELGYFDTSAISFPVGSSAANYEWVRRINALSTFEIGITFTSNNMQKVPFTPYRYEQSENGRGKASLYMGFDTTQAATDFTSNFSDVSIIPKFSGYIYNVGVDKTFVCEIYFNGPVKWLIQGG